MLKEVDRLKQKPVIYPKVLDVYCYNKLGRLRIKEGEELTIDYKFKPHNCLCDTCSSSKDSKIRLDISTAYQIEKYGDDYILEEEIEELLG